MKKVFDPKKNLTVFLWLVALHSFLVGIGIIILPESMYKLLGLEVFPGDFFRYQGGVFHIVMSIAYTGAVFNAQVNKGLVILCVIAKFMAVVFLFSYYFLIANVGIIIFSGIGDLLMGIIVLGLLKKFEKFDEINSAAKG